MADSKISALPVASSTDGTETSPIVQSGSTKQLAISKIKDYILGLSNSFTGDQTLATGNLVIGTSGKGIDFSADSNAGGMTSELLDDYEEGTFTPTLAGSTTNPTVTYGVQRGRYTRVGRLVTIECYVSWSAISGGSGNIQVAGFPYTIDSSTGANGGGAISYLDGFTFAAGRHAPGLIANASTTAASVMCMGSGVSTQFIPVASVTAGLIIFTLTYSV